MIISPFRSDRQSGVRVRVSDIRVPSIWWIIISRAVCASGAEQMIKICYRFGGYIGERVFSAKVLKRPCRKNACPLKERKDYGKISLVS